MQASSNNISPDRFDRSIEILEGDIDQISTSIEQLDPSLLIYYNPQDQKIHSVGGEWVQTLAKFERKFLDKTRLSKIFSTPFLSTTIQKVAKIFSPSPGLKPLTGKLKKRLETVMQQAVVDADGAATQERLQTIQDRIDRIKSSLESTKVQKAFQIIIHSQSDTVEQINSLREIIERSDHAILEDLNIAKLLNDQRIETLIHMAEAGGSLQGNDVLTFSEYSAIELLNEKSTLIEGGLTKVDEAILNKLPEEVRSKFGDALQSLEERMEKLQDLNPLFSDPDIRRKAETGFIAFQEIEDQMHELRERKNKGQVEQGEYERERGNLEAKKEELKPILQAIVDAKNFMRQVLSEEGEGSWLDIYSFAESGSPAFQLLGDIEQISHYQSQELDQMINQEIWNEHLQNRPVNSHPLRTLVEGAGPNGLFTGLQLFLSGSDVSIVNDRGERYVRNQIIRLDPKWTAQLRFFLGTKFDELFIGENALGRFNHGTHTVDINTKNLEDALKERMTEISSFVKSQEEPSPLNLFYEVTLEDVHLPSEQSQKFSAHLSGPRRSGADAVRYHQSLIDAEAARLLNSKYKEWDLTDTIEVNGETKSILEAANEEARKIVLEKKTLSVIEILEEEYQKEIDPDQPIIRLPTGEKISAKQQANLELEGKQPELRKIPSLDFDFLVCCGGVNDAIRNKYLGLPKAETIPKSYGIAVFVKGNTFANQQFLPQGHIPIYYENMADLKPHLENQQLDSLIKSSTFLSDHLRQKYSHLTEIILRGLVEERSKTEGTTSKPRYQENEDGSLKLGSENLAEHKIQLRMFENRLTFYTGAETAQGLSKFLEDLENEKNSLPAGNPDIPKYNVLKSEIDRRWLASIAYKFMTDGHPENEGIINMNPTKQDSEKINFDPVPINTGTFPVVQFAVETAAKELKVAKYHTSMIITALGDARASPHFYSGSGMSTGRTGIENAAFAVKHFHRGTLNRKELVAQLDRRLDKVKLQTLEKGSPYVKRSPTEERAKIAKREMCEVVNETCSRLIRKPIEGEHAYRIIRSEEISSEHPQFQLEVTSRSGSQIIYDAEVDTSGKLRINDQLYETILEAVVALEKD